MGQNPPTIEVQMILQQLQGMRDEARERSRRNDQLFDELFEKLNDQNTQIQVMQNAALANLTPRLECVAHREQRDLARRADWEVEHKAQATREEQEVKARRHRENILAAKVSAAIGAVVVVLLKLYDIFFVAPKGGG